MDSGIYIILGIVGLIGAALPDNLTKENNSEAKLNERSASGERATRVIQALDLLSNKNKNTL